MPITSDMAVEFAALVEDFTAYSHADPHAPAPPPFDPVAMVQWAYAYASWYAEHVGADFVGNPPVPLPFA